MYRLFFFFKQKTAYEMRISDWSSDVCSSDRQLQVLRLGHVDDRAQLLGQAGAAEGEARPQVGGRDVEVVVLAEDPHGLARVDADGLHQRAQLVGEGDLHRVIAVAGVLQRFGDAGGGREERRVDAGVEQIGRAAGRERVCQYV